MFHHPLSLLLVVPRCLIGHFKIPDILTALSIFYRESCPGGAVVVLLSLRLQASDHHLLLVSELCLLAMFVQIVLLSGKFLHAAVGKDSISVQPLRLSEEEFV